MRGRPLALASAVAVGGCAALLADNKELIKQESAELNRLNEAALKQVGDPAQYEGRTINVKAKVLPRSGQPGERKVEVESVEVVGESKPDAKRQPVSDKGVLDDELSAKPAKEPDVKVKALNEELAPKDSGAQR